MIEAQRVDFIAVLTNDVARAESFYGDVLGLGTFADPDGNGIMLHHRYAPYPDGSLP